MYHAEADLYASTGPVLSASAFTTAAPAMSPQPLTAKVSKGGMQVNGVEVLDLSLAGCMLEWRGWKLAEEQRVLISFPKLANLPATVLWSDDNRIGLLFTQPLHEAVYEHLIKG